MKYLFTFCVIVFTGSLLAQPCGSPPTINFNANTQDVCPGEYVTFSATVVGSIGAIDYNWFPEPSTTNSISVSPTVITWYYLEITDNCFTVIDSVKAEPAPVIISSINTVDATNCPGQPGTLGSIQVIPDSPTFTYTLFGAGNTYGPQVTNLFSNLPGGVTYFLHVENTDDCYLDSAIAIGLGSNNVTATFNVAALDDATCFGSSDGDAEITAVGSGLTSPYAVYWTNANGLYNTQTGLDAGDGDAITNLTGGDWIVTVKDQDGCAWSHTFTVDQPDEILIEFDTNNPTCYMFSDGSVTAIASGGNGGNSYVLTNSAGTQINMGGIPVVNMLTGGWYFTTITDSQGCTGTDSIYLESPDEISADITITDLICSYDGDGSIVVDSVYNSQGAYGNITYYWSPNPNGTNGIGATSITNINGGTYSLTVNDAFGCSNVFDLHVLPDALFFIEIGSEPYSTSMDGVVYAAADGGSAPYSYTWTNLANGSTHNGTVWGSLQPGEYQILVTDDNGCVLIDTVTIGYLGADELNAENNFRVYPKLVQNSVIYIENSGSSETTFSLYNLSGQLVFSSDLTQGINELFLSLSDGSYSYNIQSNGLYEEVLTRGKIVVAGK